MPTIAELKQQRDASRQEIYRLRDLIANDNRDFTAEEQTRWNNANEEFNSFNRRIDVLERGEAIDREMRDSGDDRGIGRDDRSGERESRGGSRRQRAPRVRNLIGGDGASADGTQARLLALQTWARGGKRARKGHVDACRSLGVDPSARDLRIRLGHSHEVRNLCTLARSVPPSQQMRAMQTLDGSAGGYLVSDEFVRSLEVAMVAYGGMRQVSQIIRTATGGEMPWPTADDTSNTGEIIGEDSTASEADPTIGQQIWRSYLYSSKVIRVSNALLEDSAVNLAAELGMMLGERLGRIHNTHFTTGTGSNQPRGVITDATVGKTTASATAITADEVLDLIASVDPAYRANATFMCHDTIMFYIRKLKDSYGQYLWNADIKAGMPDRIWGYPTQVNQSMASSVATTNKTAAFGDFSKYKIREVRSVRLRRLDELYAAKDQVGFVAFVRADGKLLTTGSPVKVMQQA